MVGAAGLCRPVNVQSLVITIAVLECHSLTNSFPHSLDLHAFRNMSFGKILIAAVSARPSALCGSIHETPPTQSTKICSPTSWISSSSTFLRAEMDVLCALFAQMSVAREFSFHPLRPEDASGDLRAGPASTNQQPAGGDVDMTNVDASWALNDIEEGTILFAEKPLVAVQDVSNRARYLCCATCHGPAGALDTALALAASRVSRTHAVHHEAELVEKRGVGKPAASRAKRKRPREKAGENNWVLGAPRLPRVEGAGAKAECFASVESTKRNELFCSRECQARARCALRENSEPPAALSKPTRYSIRH